jgi:hypothetical protein
MKRIIVTIAIAVVIALAFKKCHDEKALDKRIERMNAHIKYLHDEEGYSWEAARKIGATEAGFIPQDEQYLILKED